MERSNLRARDVESFISRDRKLGLLMAKAQSGNGDAYRELLEEVQKMIRPFLTKKLKSFGFYSSELAEDLVQDTLIAIHEKRQTYDPSVPFGPWMFAIARYKLIDAARKSRREVSWDELDDLDSVLGSLLPETETPGSAQQDLQTLMSGLNEKQQAVLYQAKIEGLSMREIAEKTNMSESSVKVTLHRTLILLKDKFKKEDQS